MLEDGKRRLWLPWISLGVLTLLCGALSALQYRWLGEVSVADRQRLKESLQTNLSRLAREFNSDTANACAALLPDRHDDAAPEDYALRFAAWRDSSGKDQLFSRIALAVPRDESLTLLILDPAKAVFAAGEWPQAWIPVRDRLLRRWIGGPREGDRGPGGMLADLDLPVLDVPHFRRGEPGQSGPRESEWLLLEFNMDYLRSTVFPALIDRHLASAGQLDYEVSIVTRRSGAAIYSSGSAGRVREQADGAVTMFEVPMEQLMRRGRREQRGPRPDSGRWELAARHKGGSLDAIVQQARWRNLGVATLILLLMLATGGVLIESIRRTQQLAALQMDFVAGVSHELRTPLTVIRTAAFNLRGKLAANPAHVERYGTLIQKESEKLTSIVEDVLRFSSARGGQIVREREPVSIELVIEQGLESSKAALAEFECEVEKNIAAGLPVVLGDSSALRHALQNLLSNAAKYGTEHSRWIGVSASRAKLDADAPAVEIRVADRGLGIPAEEQAHIFEPFFRGSRAVADQIHGTGLGLNLVRKIVEAHAGKISVVSEQGKGTEFVILIPAAPQEYQDEFSHIAD